MDTHLKSIPALKFSLLKRHNENCISAFSLYLATSQRESANRDGRLNSFVLSKIRRVLIKTGYPKGPVEASLGVHTLILKHIAVTVCCQCWGFTQAQSHVHANVMAWCLWMDEEGSDLKMDSQHFHSHKCISVWTEKMQKHNEETQSTIEQLKEKYRPC